MDNPFNGCIPTESLLRQTTESIDYCDRYQAILVDPEEKVNSTVLCRLFFDSGPAWIDRLFEFRNKIVKVFGLKVSDSDDRNRDLIKTMKFEPGDRVGLFSVFEKNEHEVVLGEDDKHLNFRVSLMAVDRVEMKGEKSLYVTTVVHFNNWWGRLYFLPVRPFHKLIVPAMVRNMMGKIRNS